MTGPDPAMEAFGMLFGLFGILYLLVALFILILTVVFIFKAMGFMKKKTANDDRLIQAIERLEQKTNHDPLNARPESTHEDSQQDPV
jgi:uncharacterized membrane protein